MNSFVLALILQLLTADPNIRIEPHDDGIQIHANLKKGYTYCLEESTDLETWYATQLGCVNGRGQDEWAVLYPAGNPQFYRILWSFTFEQDPRFD